MEPEHWTMDFGVDYDMDEPPVPEPEEVVKPRKQRETDKKKFYAEDCDGIMELGDHGEPGHRKQFRVSNKYLLLTYKHHWDYEAGAEWFKKTFGANTVNMSHENGSGQVPYAHTHFVLEFKRPFKSTNQRIFDTEDGVHPNIRFLPFRKAYLQAIEYIKKEGIKVVVEETDFTTNLFDDCQGLTRDEILKKCKTFSEVPGALALSNVVSKSEVCVPNIKLRDWQAAIMELLKFPSSRKVYWFCDYKGGCGKSTFARWLYAKNPNEVLVLSQLGGVRDAATIIDGALTAGWSQKLMILDLARASEHKAIYEPIEQIKNGCMNTVKYQGKPLWFNSPHLIVFANFYPDKSQLSADRWSIYVIDDNAMLEG